MANSATLLASKPIKGLLIGFLIAATAALMALLFGLPRASIALIGCLSLLLTLWSNQALPLGLVALLPLILFPGLGIL